MYKVPPKANSLYNIVKGDTLPDIAAYVYGDSSKYLMIWNANKTWLRSGDPNVVYPGEFIWIPKKPKSAGTYEGWSLRQTGSGKNTNYDRNAFTLLVEGTPHNVTNGSWMSTFDTPADGWVADLRFDPFDFDMTQNLRPYGYQECEVYLGNEYMGDSTLYNVHNDWDATKTNVKLEGFTQTVDIIDSVSQPSFKAKNITLEAWITRLVEPFGLTVDYRPTDDERIKKVKIGKTEKIGSHIDKWVKERGYVLSNDLDGNLVVHEVEKPGKISGNFTQYGSTTLQSGKISFLGRGRFSKVMGYSSKPRKHSGYTYVSPSLPCNRVTAVTVNGTDDGDIEDAVSRAARESMDRALSISVPTRSWYNEDNILWKPGQYVTVQSDKMHLYKVTTLLVKAVEFLIDSKSRMCVLTLVPPSMYQKGEVIDPWNLA